MAAGRSFREVIDKGIDRALFIQQQEEKAPKRLPRRTGEKQKTGTLFAKRNKRLTIREAAKRLVQVVMTYKKTTTGEVKKYIVAPYSYRYRKLKVGLRKMLFAFDTADGHIKGFSLKDIRNVALTDRKFKPKWEVEI
jgi:hypothetical protein